MIIHSNFKTTFMIALLMGTMFGIIPVQATKVSTLIYGIEFTNEVGWDGGDPENTMEFYIKAACKRDTFPYAWDYESSYQSAHGGDTWDKSGIGSYDANTLDIDDEKLKNDLTISFPNCQTGSNNLKFTVREMDVGTYDTVIGYKYCKVPNNGHTYTCYSSNGDNTFSLKIESSAP